MSAGWEDVAAAARHPALDGVAEGAARDRLGRLAHGLAAWLVGVPASALPVLPRVIVTVAGRGLRDARALCEGRPLLAVESGARAAVALWPWLRGADEPDEPAPDPPDDAGDGEGAGGNIDPGDAEASGIGGPAGDGDPKSGDPGAPGDDGGESADGPGDEGSSAASPDPPSDADALLRRLAEEEASPELDVLAQALGSDGEAKLVELGQAAADAAWRGARDGEATAAVLERLVPGVGWGAQPGMLSRVLLDGLGTWVKLLDVLPELAALADRLGRLEAASRREGLTDGGSEEVVGVTLGGDVSRALPGELALLADPDTEDLFYLRLLEQRLVSLQLAGAGLDGVAVPERRGPVLIALDTSGSMRGAPGIVARALVLAVARRVLPQGRVVHLLSFGGHGEATELRLRRGEGGIASLLTFLAQRFDGGTDFDTPLKRALELIEEDALARADVLIVTDGQAGAGEPIVRAVAAARASLGLRVYAAVVAGGPLDGVRPFCDEVWPVDPRQPAAHALLETLEHAEDRRRPW